MSSSLGLRSNSVPGQMQKDKDKDKSAIPMILSRRTKKAIKEEELSEDMGQQEKEWRRDTL